jgi:small GTP-binding protein
MPRRFSFKVVLTGDIGVGKTSLVNQFILKKFEKDYISTIGVNILLKDLELELDGSIYTVQLMFWDIGGQEKYTNVRHMFYRGASAAIIIYDITRPATFLVIPEFLQDLEQTLTKKIPFIILGNKVDLSDNRRVDKSNAENLKETTEALAFYETSAKTGENVEHSFKMIGEACLKDAVK